MQSLKFEFAVLKNWKVLKYLSETPGKIIMFLASFILKCQSLKVNSFQLHVLKFSPFFLIKAYLEKWSMTVSPFGLHLDSNVWTVKQLTYMTEGIFCYVIDSKKEYLLLRYVSVKHL